MSFKTKHYKVNLDMEYISSIILTHFVCSVKTSPDFAVTAMFTSVFYRESSFRYSSSLISKIEFSGTCLHYYTLAS